MKLAFSIATLLLPLAGPAAQPPADEARLLCDAVYMPTRAVWQRDVAIEYDDARIKTVRIDGLKVYTFEVNVPWIFTALDNQWIQIKAATETWTSDFRGLASAQGRCNWVKPAGG